MYNWPFSDLEHFYYTWFAPSYSETISFGVVVKSTNRAFRKHILYIPLLIFVHHTGLQMQKNDKKWCFYTFSFFRNHPVNFQATLPILSNYSVNLVCLGPVSQQKLEVLEQISGHKVQLKSKSHKKRTSVSIMFQFPPQIVLGCSNSKWYLNLVFHPLNTSCKNQEPTRHEHNVTAFYTKLYWFHHGRSLPRTFSPLTFSITEPSQLHSSSAIVLLVSVIMHL